MEGWRAGVGAQIEADKFTKWLYFASVPTVHESLVQVNTGAWENGAQHKHVQTLSISTSERFLTERQGNLSEIGPGG